MHTTIDQSELIKRAPYESHYNPDKLFAIARQPKRDELGIRGKLPFYGVDIWNHYEVSWLNPKGKPIVAVAEMIYGCDSTAIIESKSMKLYFNSLNNTSFKHVTDVENVLKNDLAKLLHTENLMVKITPLSLLLEEKVQPRLSGIHLDELDIECTTYVNQPGLLTVENDIVTETLISDLLKSNCLVTNQPDWGSVQISYTGKKINHAGLLQYLVSFRNDNEFHEHCIEKIYMHIMQRCAPEELTVYGRWTRRGGMDINSYRSSKKDVVGVPNTRLYRQ